jgi:hypothetical protein
VRRPKTSSKPVEGVVDPGVLLVLVHVVSPDGAASLRYEVEVLVHHPLDSTACHFPDSVIPSANRVLRYRAEGG